MDENAIPQYPFLLALKASNGSWLAIEAKGDGLELQPMSISNKNQQWLPGANPIDGAPVTVFNVQVGDKKFVASSGPGSALTLGGPGNQIWSIRQHESLYVYTVATLDLKEGWQVDSPAVGAKVKAAYNFPATALWTVVPAGLTLKAE